MKALPRIALTGATGLAGRWLLKGLLDAGYPDIRCLAEHPVPDTGDSRITWVEGHLLDPFSLEELVEGCAVVIHTAGLTSYRLLDKARLFQINGQGTGHLVNAALHGQVRHFLYIGSAFGLGTPPLPAAVQEEAEWVKSPWNTPFAESTYQGELEVWRGREEGLEVTVLLPTLLLDPEGISAPTDRLLAAVLAGRTYYTEGSTGVLDVRDLVRFVLTCMATGPTNERVILNAENMPYAMLQAELARAMGAAPPSRLLPLWRARWIAWWNKLLSRHGLHPQEVMLAYRPLTFDATRSREKYRFSYTPPKQTITDIARHVQGAVKGTLR